MNNTIILIIFIAFVSVVNILHLSDARQTIITAIQDNGCSSHQELSQTKSNADVYNYAALSTSY